METLETKKNDWRKWLYEYIHDDIEKMMVENHIFKEVRSLYNNLFEFSDSMFIQYLYLTYGTSASVAIRRQIVSGDRDRRKENICLMKLLKDINKYNDTELSSIGISKAKLNDDIGTLQNMKNVKDFVDKKVAHLDGDLLLEEEFPRYDEILDYVIKISEIFERYYTVIVGPVPLIQFKVLKNSNHWKDIFKQPWITN